MQHDIRLVSVTAALKLMAKLRWQTAGGLLQILTVQKRKKMSTCTFQQHPVKSPPNAQLCLHNSSSSKETLSVAAVRLVVVPLLEQPVSQQRNWILLDPLPPVVEENHAASEKLSPSIRSAQLVASILPPPHCTG
jgi:hypothetical protein